LAEPAMDAVDDRSAVEYRVADEGTAPRRHLVQHVRRDDCTDDESERLELHWEVVLAELKHDAVHHPPAAPDDSDYPRNPHARLLAHPSDSRRSRGGDRGRRRTAGRHHLRAQSTRPRSTALDAVRSIPRAARARRPRPF